MNAWFATAFTPAVEAEQVRAGSRENYARAAERMAVHDRFGEAEAAFLEARDACYLATVSATGWPYVQIRGGEPGFLRVLDDRTLAWGDLHGNAQFVSVGNTRTDDRASLIAVDYPNRRRLKLFGHLGFVDADEEPELAARLRVGAFVPERVARLTLTGFSWNCPKYIPQRYSAAELQPLMDRLAALEVENAELRALVSSPRGG